MKIIFTSILICLAHFGFSQSDTLNIVNEAGQKHGLWVTYGKDRPSLGYCDSCIVESGKYVKDEKEGPWITYDKEGNIKRTIVYKVGRPFLLGISSDTSKVLLDFSSDEHPAEIDSMIDEFHVDTLDTSQKEKNYYLFHIDFDGILIGTYVEGGRIMDDKLQKYDSEGVLVWFEIWKVKQRKIPIDW